MSYIRGLLLVSYVLAITFMVTALTFTGVGIPTLTDCRSAIYICIFFLFASKATLQLFLVERAHVANINYLRRRDDPVWLAAMAVLGTAGVAVMGWTYANPVAFIAESDGMCRKGLPPKVVVPVQVLDTVCNMVLTGLFIAMLKRTKGCEPFDARDEVEVETWSIRGVARRASKTARRMSSAGVLAARRVSWVGITAARKVSSAGMFAARRASSAGVMAMGRKASVAATVTSEQDNHFSDEENERVDELGGWSTVDWKRRHDGPAAVTRMATWTSMSPEEGITEGTSTTMGTTPNRYANAAENTNAKPARLRHLARKSLIGTLLILSCAIANGVVFIINDGKEHAWLCFTQCNLDGECLSVAKEEVKHVLMIDSIVALSVFVLHWLTSDPKDDERASRNDSESERTAGFPSRACSVADVLKNMRSAAGRHNSGSKSRESSLVELSFHAMLAASRRCSSPRQRDNSIVEMPMQAMATTSRRGSHAPARRREDSIIEVPFPAMLKGYR